MRTFLQFLRTNRNLLFFGILLTFFSSFGQTFLISLYIPKIEEVFSLSNTALSSLYAVATTASALSLPWIGRLIDTVALQRFTIGVICGLAAACLIFSLAIHPVLVLLGFFGLRLFGQGLMSHTSISTMARAFAANRGKAISIATLGHPLGEATLPLLVALGIGALGWRSTLQISAFSLLVLILPLIYLLLKDQSPDILHPHHLLGDQKQKSKNPFLVMKDRAFWIITPAVFITGFLNTAIFFYQIKLGESRGWDPAWVAGSLSVYALASALSMMGSGPLVDRFTAFRLFPFMLIPYTFGVVLLSLLQHPLSYPAALVLIGVSNGSGSTIKNALFAEIFGTEIIGTVRSVFTTVIVFSTALGPLAFGLFLDGGWSYGSVFGMSVGLLLLVIFWSATLSKRKVDRHEV